MNQEISSTLGGQSTCGSRPGRPGIGPWSRSGVRSLPLCPADRVPGNPV